MILYEVFLPRATSQFLLRPNQPIFPTSLTLATSLIYHFRVQPKSLPSLSMPLNTLPVTPKCRIQGWPSPKDNILRIYRTKISSKIQSFSIFPPMQPVVFMLMEFPMTVMRERSLISSGPIQAMSRRDLSKRRLSRVESSIIVLLISRMPWLLRWLFKLSKGIGLIGRTIRVFE